MFFSSLSKLKSFTYYFCEDLSKNPNSNFYRIYSRTITDMIFGRKTYVGGIDIIKENDHVKIEHFCANDSEYAKTVGKSEHLNKGDATKVYDHLLTCAESVAKQNGLTKIKIDVHSNLRRYDDLLKGMGFNLTDKRCLDNPFWIESEKVLARA